MSRFDNEVRVTPSVLDRLIDYEPEMSREAPASRSKSLRLIKQSLKRDLEWLLNTRSRAVPLPDDLKEVNASLAAFGLPDFTTANARSGHDQQRMRRALETAIAVFEPRLEGVVITVADGSERSLRFRIDGRLKVDPAPEPITFDTTLDVGSGAFAVKGE